ncbi:MAG: hypothetical protein AAB372_02095 [Patescibacteria group bacterium]
MTSTGGTPRVMRQRAREDSPDNGIIVRIDGGVIAHAEHRGEWRNLSPARYWWIRNGSGRRCCLTLVTISDGGRRDEGGSLDLTDVPTGVLEAVVKFRTGVI